MGCEPDEWAKKWLEKQREAGERCLTVEKRADGQHYVIRATTVWVPETKKRRKVSEYLGRLQPDGTLYKRPKREVVHVREVKHRGCSLVLAKATDDLMLPLETCFPKTYREIVALVWTRVMYTGVLKNVSDEWDSIADVLSLNPVTNPRSLSDVLHTIGGQWNAWHDMFDMMDDGNRHMAVDLSVCFSRANDTTILKKGYNRFRLKYTQFKIAVTCDMKTGKMVSIRPIAGNVKENTLLKTILESDLSGDVLVMDRGYFSEKVFDELDSGDIDYVVAARRNSKYYDRVQLTDSKFSWNRRVIRYGMSKVGTRYFYRFEDAELRMNEELDILEKIEGSMELDPDSRDGNILVCSSMNLDPRSIFLMYKNREAVEEGFDAGKSRLDLDRTYMHDDEGIWGHVLITFLAARVRGEMMGWIAEAGMTAKLSPEDLLRKYASVYSLRSPDSELVYDVGADVKKLDKALGLNLYQ